MTDKDKYRSLCNTEKSIPLFSRDWWLDTVCGNENWHVFLIEEKGCIQAALPVYIPHPGIISMPPYTQTMGPWFATGTAPVQYTKTLGKQQVLSKLLIEKIKSYPHFLQNFNYLITDWLPFYWNGYKQTTRYTYLLRDIQNQSLLWEKMRPNIRRNILKAKDKYHITVQRGIPVNDFLQIQSLTFERQHQSIKADTNRLKNLIQVCRERNQGDIWGGYDKEGRLHAAAFIVWQESSAYYLAGGGNPALRNSGAHSLVLWECIQNAANYSGIFDFEGSMLPGVERFFREFGAEQIPYFTITKGHLSLLHRAWLKLKKSNG